LAVVNLVPFGRTYRLNADASKCRERSNGKQVFANGCSLHRNQSYGSQRYLVILAIDPSPVSGDDPEARAQAVRQALTIRDKNSQIAAWKRQVPSAHMVLIPHATHLVFQSNEADVLREMNAFIASLS
jgi:hypothetical protein